MFKTYRAMKILRTIETFYPYVCGPANQAFQISRGLEERGIASPVLTTYCDVDPTLPAKETINGVEVYRHKNQARIMRYCLSLGMAMSFRDYDILHAHNYRNFQSDLAFFFPVSTRNPLSSAHTAPFSASRNTSTAGNQNSLMRSTTPSLSRQRQNGQPRSSSPLSWNTKTPLNLE
ncbi:MAG: hypothetical protein HZA01_12290 [Nitrospinae bacterium]|nr:hypothetical protein [Nitrospinota bacterium]